MQVFNADGPVHKLLYHEDRHVLVTVTSSLMLSQHSVSPEGDCREILKVSVAMMSVAMGREIKVSVGREDVLLWAERF